jgi:hypothetical protein
MGVDTGQGGEVVLQQLICPNHEVTLFVTVDCNVRHLQVAVYGRGELSVHLKHLEGVADGYGIEDGLQVVVAVGATLNNIQSEVDLANRMGYHSAGFII